MPAERDICPDEWHVVYKRTPASTKIDMMIAMAVEGGQCRHCLSARPASRYARGRAAVGDSLGEAGMCAHVEERSLRATLDSAGAAAYAQRVRQ